MGSGKSTLLAEASDLLAQRNIPHAAIDADALSLACLPAETPTSIEDIQFTNLRSICENYAAIGITRFILTRALEDRAEREACQSAVAATQTIVVRIIASLETMQQRIRSRETGILQQQFIDRVATLNAILDAAHLEDFTVANDSRSITDAALEVLLKANWIAE